MPAPIGANAGCVANNYIPIFSGITTTQIPSFKIDQIMGPKGKLAYYFSRNALFQPISTAFGGGADGLPDPITTAVGSIVPTWVTQLNYDYSLTPTMLPIENMNLGRTWRIKERASFNIRMEFSNVFNRSVFSDPASTNAKAVITRAPNGNITGGFGSIAAPRQG